MSDKKSLRFPPLAARFALFLATCAFFVAFSSKAFGADAVGLSARGVAISYAASNSLHLDMRDALGRPISQSLIQKELKTASARLRAKTEFFSALPKAQAISFFLECLWKISTASWALPVFWPSIAHFWALPAPRKTDWGVFELLFLALFQASSLLSLVCAASFRKEISHRDFSVLRC